MRSVADQLRRQTIEQLAHLSPAERVRLALQLGDADLEAFSKAQGLDRSVAVRLLEQRRQADRRRSACLESLLQ